MSHLSSPPQKHKGERKGHGLPRGSERGSSSRDKDRSVTVSSSVPMPAGGKGSRTNCSQPTPQKVPNRLIITGPPWPRDPIPVGYSTCHWCHMMEEESFQNEEIGRLLNEDFVSVKVDREERPDVDKVYMTFVQVSGLPGEEWLPVHVGPLPSPWPSLRQATSSGGGWPMSVWLTPNLQPFWKQNKSTLLENSQRVTAALLARSEISMGDRQLPPSAATMSSRCFQQLDEGYDEEYGGFAEAPKFPTPVILSFLFSYWLSHRLTQDGSRAQQMALHTLKMMANGGIRDHVGQGFHRYSTDRQWHVPHFEKMLYDQAQLTVAYSQAFQISGDEFYSEVAKGILQYVARNLSHRSGGFYSAEDADSPPERGMRPKEGAFYDPKGELQGQNVLTVRYSLELTAARFGLEVEAVRTLLNSGLEKLFQARKHRPKPHLDSKMLAAWNGLMVSGFAVTGAVLGQERLISYAISGAKFLKRHMFDVASGRLMRTCYAGSGGTDYAFVVRGLLDLYEASQESAWLEWALRLQDTQDRLFWDSRGGGYFCSEAELGAGLPLRLKDAPLHLSLELPFCSGQIVICGDPQAKDTKALLQCVHSIYIPNKVLILADGDPSSFLSRQLPFLSTLRRLEDQATAYVCENQACSMPITEPCELRKLLHQ
ncbi:hypothetical protein E2I00_015642 [Balaenoptera physalus]|uniref:Spermatogenesis-associated protein 20 n=1 Tax=Balaenoptera physalus TaxID=9770 RepID=A0A643C2L2_BALPH|nr:hypothetical protein E2I00_015642 [Balaenoptera physalus]